MDNLAGDPGCFLSGVGLDAGREALGREEAEASASAVLEMMRGDCGVENEELGSLVTLKGIIQTQNRIRCATLAWDAMRRGLKDGERLRAETALE